MPRTDRHRGRGATWLTLMSLASAAVAAALALRVVALLTRGTGELQAFSPGLPVEQLVEVGALGVGAVAAAWLAASCVVAVGYVATARLGRRWRAGEAILERAAPALVRRLARTAVGVGVGTGLALAPTAALAADAPAEADGGSGAAVAIDLGWQPTGTAAHAGADLADTRPDPAPGDASTSSVVAPAAADGDDPADENPGPDPKGPTVEESTTTLATTVAHVDRAGPAQEGTRVVLRGDTLWDIAATALVDEGTPAPSDAEILREATRWHDANRDVVGTDPDVILPGQVLRVPS